MSRCCLHERDNLCLGVDLSESQRSGRSCTALYRLDSRHLQAFCSRSEAPHMSIRGLKFQFCPVFMLMLWYHRVFEGMHAYILPAKGWCSLGCISNSLHISISSLCSPALEKIPCLPRQKSPLTLLSRNGLDMFHVSLCFFYFLSCSIHYAYVFLNDWKHFQDHAFSNARSWRLPTFPSSCLPQLSRPCALSHLLCCSFHFRNMIQSPSPRFLPRSAIAWGVACRI